MSGDVTSGPDLPVKGKSCECEPKEYGKLNGCTRHIGDIGYADILKLLYFVHN